MGRARENFSDVNFRDEKSGLLVPFGSRFNVLCNVFWNIMDGHVLVREAPYSFYSIEARGNRCYLVEESKAHGTSNRYEILNYGYGELRSKVKKKLAEQE